MPSITKTLVLVKAALSGQKDKQGVSKFDHCVRVSKNMETLMKRYDIEDQNFIAAALLHDIVEDSDISPYDLYLFGYSNAVIDAVEQLTHDEENSYQDYIDNLCVNGSLMALLAKLADNMDNDNEDRMKDLPEGFCAYLKKRYGGVRGKLQNAIDNKINVMKKKEELDV